MRRNRCGSLMVAIAVLFGACSAAAAEVDRQESGNSNDFTYRYLSLSEQLPSSMGCFSAAHLGENGDVFGTVEIPPPEYCGEGLSPKYVVVYRHHRFKAVAPGYANTANERGGVAGAVFDEGRQAWRAALFLGTQVKQLPLLSPSELFSQAIGLTDSGTALIESFSGFHWPPRPEERSHGVYRAGRLTRIDLGLGPVVIATPRINDRGQLSGTIVAAYPPDPAKPDRAFIHDWRCGKTTILDPQSTDVHSNGRDINARGRVLGYSIERFGGPTRIGVWAGQRPFKMWLDEADYGFMSEWLRFNNAGMIVASGMSNNQIYLIPRPGTVIDVVARTAHFPAGLAKGYVYVGLITERGDMLGGGALFDAAGQYIRGENFILRRVPH